MGGETGGNLLVECCNFNAMGEEDCVTTNGNTLIFPTTTCDFLGLAFAMPTCWDESKGIGIKDPIGHMAYTTDGTVGGPCPAGYNKRVPQVQLFVRVNQYQGGTYQLSDGSNVFHVDFVNGWQEGKLEEILRKCVPSGLPGYNPPCDCTQFLTENVNVSGTACDEETKQYVLNEDTNRVTSLPRGTCQGPSVVAKSWDVDPPFKATCGNVGGGGGGNEEDGGDEDEDEEGNDDENEEDDYDGNEDEEGNGEGENGENGGDEGEDEEDNGDENEEDDYDDNEDEESEDGNGTENEGGEEFGNEEEDEDESNIFVHSKDEGDDDERRRKALRYLRG